MNSTDPIQLVIEFREKRKNKLFGEEFVPWDIWNLKVTLTNKPYHEGILLYYLTIFHVLQNGVK